MGPIGHLAIGLAAKPAAPRVPLVVLILATQVLDLLTLAFLATGVERLGVTQTDLSQGLVMLSPASIPWSHGLFMSLLWSALAAGIAFRVFRDLAQARLLASSSSATGSSTSSSIQRSFLYFSLVHQGSASACGAQAPA